MNNKDIKEIFKTIKQEKIKEEEYSVELIDEFERLIEDELFKHKNNVITFGSFDTVKFNRKFIKKCCNFNYILVDKYNSRELLNSFLVVKPNIIQILLMLLCVKRVYCYIAFSIFCLYAIHSNSFPLSLLSMVLGCVIYGFNDVNDGKFKKLIQKYGRIG